MCSPAPPKGALHSIAEAQRQKPLHTAVRCGKIFDSSDLNKEQHNLGRFGACTLHAETPNFKKAAAISSCI